MKTADIVRKQVMPCLIPIKVFMKIVHGATSSATSEPQKSPRGGKLLSPRSKSQGSDEAAVIGAGDVPLQKHAGLTEYTAQLQSAGNDVSGFEFVDLFCGNAPLARHLRLPTDDLMLLSKSAIGAAHLESNETQLLKIVYGQAVESRARGGKSHDVHTPMLLHVVYSVVKDAAADAWLSGLAKQQGFNAFF